MDEARRSNRPTPRTPAAVEAELRRRIRAELAEARKRSDGELADAALAEVIARAIGAALGWHLEAPEHSRNATLSSRTWRGAGGPRGGGAPRDFDGGPPQRGPRQFGGSSSQFGGGSRQVGGDADVDGRPERGPRQGGPRSGGGGRPGTGGGFGQRRDFEPRRPQEGPFDEFEDRPRRAPGPRRPSGPRGGGGGRPGGRGGFGPRRSR
jgi:translation initiation factor IF-2